MDPYGYDDGADDQQAQALAALAGIPIQQAKIEAKRRRGQAMFATPTPQGREVGRTYVASSPLEHLAAAMTRTLGLRDMRAADADMGPLIAQQQAGAAAQARQQRAAGERDYGLRLYDANTRRIAAENKGLSGAAAPSKQAYADAQARRASPASEDMLSILEDNGVKVWPGITHGEAVDALRGKWAVDARPGQIVQTEAGPVEVRRGKAVPIAAPKGVSLKPPKTVHSAGPRMPESYVKDLESFADAHESVTSLQSRFRPEFAGGGAAGEVRAGLAKRLGSWGNQGSQEYAAFWADWDKLVNLPERNKTFGASLSANEQTSWEGARTIKPGTDPKIVMDKFRELERIAREKGAGRVKGGESEGYSPEALHSYSRGRFKTQGGASDPDDPLGIR